MLVYFIICNVNSTSAVHDTASSFLESFNRIIIWAELQTVTVVGVACAFITLINAYARFVEPSSVATFLAK